MVSPEVTQPVQSPHPRQGESVRITAEIRRRVLIEHYEDRARYARAVTIEATNNRDSLALRHQANPEAVRPYQIDQANAQLTAARTVEQDIKATLAAYGNRDFRAVTR